jgi:predicted amidohydrolase
MTTAALRVAAVQLNSQDDVGKNLDECERLVGEAANRGAKMVLLPENLAYFGPEDGKRRIAENLSHTASPIAARLAATARNHGVTVVAGGIPEQSSDPSRPYNTCAVFGPAGELVARYRKIHLFDVKLTDGTSLCESNATSRGEEPVVVEVGGFKIGLSICYDVRFPELYRALVDRGAEVLVVPAAFTVHTGKDHWHVLLRARAIESQSYVVAAAQWGKHPKGRTTYGHSLIVDPWGTVLSDAPDKPCVVMADLEKADVTRVRTSLPSLQHRVL